MNITMQFAGVPMDVMLRTGEYLDLYRPFLSTLAPVCRVFVEDPLPDYDCCISEGYAEHMALCVRVSDRLLDYRRVVFHGLAFLWREKAWIFTAPPSTGKTTQYVLWKMCYGDEVTILNGDKPILAAEDGRIVVHPSPWNGKENMSCAASAPLGGIILLEQGRHNRMERIRSGAAIPIYRQLLYSAQDADAVRHACEIEDTILRTVPVWKLTNRGDKASAKLCHDTLEEALK